MGDELGIIRNGAVKRTREWDGSDGWNEDVRINQKLLVDNQWPFLCAITMVAGILYVYPEN